jgi:two-component system cell cycle sensor histidine kinase/response regulator CckA
MCVRSAGALLLLASVVGLAIGQTPALPLTDAERAFVAAHPTVRLMVDPHYEPADFVDATGTHSGMAADLLTLLAERTGLTFVPVPLDADRRKELDPVKRGVDGVALSAMTKRRSEFYLSTEPVLEFPAYILTRRSVDRFLTPIDLVGQKVGVVDGYATEEYLRTNYPRLALTTYPTTDAGLRAVSYGEIDAFISTIPVSTYWLEQHGYTNLKIAGETGYIYRLGVTSRKDWPELNAILEKGVASITPEERDDIRRKWLNAPYEPFFRSRRFWVPVLWLTFALLAAVFGVLVWNRVLRQAVADRTRQLAASESLYRATLENVSDGVLLVRADGSVAFANRGAERVFGTPAAAVLAGTVRDLLGADLAGKVAAEPDGVYDAEVSRPDPAGGRRVLLATVTPVAIRDAVRLYVCHDVTDRHRLERELRQRKTLESVGLLASGVAHDFNNLLQVIGGFAQMAGSDKATAETRKGYLGRVTEATDRATSLTRQLLAIARRKPTDKTAFDVGPVTAGLVTLAGGLVGRGVEIRSTPAPQPLTVVGDPSQLEQVLLNLLVNARDAMPKGGTATVTWAACDVSETLASAHPGVRPGRFARLRVSDTGTGIPAAVRSRIFEPFFTTKAEGKGTGLGLAVVFGVAQEAGGFVDVQSEEGVGTTCEVYWPLAGDTLPP